MLQKIKYIFASILIFVVAAFPQGERYTKGAENGYMWLAMDDPILIYNTSRENYLSSILDRFRVTNEKHPEIASLSCREDIDELSREGKTDKFSLEDVVKEIDSFYSSNDNLVIPIIFAYCYTIKKFVGADAEELNKYKQDVLTFCNE
jgi:hypothetical protein